MIDAIWEHDYYKDCIPNFSDNLSKPRHRWYEFKEGYVMPLYRGLLTIMKVLPHLIAE